VTYFKVEAKGGTMKKADEIQELINEYSYGWDKLIKIAYDIYYREMHQYSFYLSSYELIL
jgi:hypothetical protein